MAGLTHEEYEKEFLAKVGKAPIRGRIRLFDALPTEYVRCNNCPNQAVTGIMITARQLHASLCQIDTPVPLCRECANELSKLTEAPPMVKCRLLGPEVRKSGRRYSLAARKQLIEQAPGKFVYDRTGRTGMLLLAHVVGEVKSAELEDEADGDDAGEVMIHAEPLTEIGKALFRDLEAGRAQCFSMGTGNPEKVDGVDEVGADFKFTGVGIEPTPPKDDD